MIHSGVRSTALLEELMPNPEVRKRHETTVDAPTPVVYRTAYSFDISTLWLVQRVFWLRAKVLGASQSGTTPAGGFVEALLAMGWHILAEEPGRFLIVGAACQPWVADVVFTPIPRVDFPSFAAPDHVKIIWTIEVDRLNIRQTRLATETRVASTDAVAHVKFRRYWRRFGLGIKMIRWLLLPAIRRAAERQSRAE